MNGILYPATPISMLSAMAVYCMECRAKRAHRRFMSRELGLPEGSYKQVVLPGGVAGMSRLSKEKAGQAFKPVKFTLEEFRQIRRAILIFHDDCGLYKVLRRKYSDFYGPKDVMMERQINDLRVVADEICLCRPEMKVELYRAIAVGKGPKHWTFEQVSL